MIYFVISIIILGLAYLAWEVFRVVRLNWRAFARFGESIGKAGGRMAAVEAPEIPSRPVETPHQVRDRIALKRENGRQQRLSRTIDRWEQNFHA